MATSKKSIKKLKHLTDKAANDVLEKYFPEINDAPPEEWTERNKIMFDLVYEYQRAVERAIDEVLGA